MSHPTIRDDHLARLPLTQARAELLREIVQTPVLSETRTPRPHRRWVPVLSAAAVLAVLAVPVHYLGTGEGPGPSTPTTAGPTPASSDTRSPVSCTRCQGRAPAVAGGGYVVLNAGWRMDHIASDPYTTGDPGFYAAHRELETPRTTVISYLNGRQRLTVSTYPLADRERGDERGGTPSSTTLLGRPATLLTFDPTDHAVVRPFGASHYLDVVGEGMDLTTYRALLAELVETDTSGLASVVPPPTVTPLNRSARVPALLDGVALPAGLTATNVPLVGFNDGYSASVRLGNTVKCAWLAEYQRPATRRPALAAFDASLHWPLLRRIADRGDYAAGFWAISRQLRTGTTAAELTKGSCP